MIFFFSKFINYFYGINFINLQEKKIRISHTVAKNNNFTNFLRIRLLGKKKEKFFVFKNQDSSMQKILKDSDGIWVRQPNEKKINKNDLCHILVFNNSFVEEI